MGPHEPSTPPVLPLPVIIIGVHTEAVAAPDILHEVGVGNGACIVHQALYKGECTETKKEDSRGSLFTSSTETGQLMPLEVDASPSEAPLG